jgi:hypothetical protein
VLKILDPYTPPMDGRRTCLRERKVTGF